MFGDTANLDFAPLVECEECKGSGSAQNTQPTTCQTCHGQQAPTMAGLFGKQQRMADGSTVTADENYIRESILNSTAQVVAGYQPIMPSYRGQISEEQVASLLAYIKRLADVVLAKPCVDRGGVRVGGIEYASNKV